MLWAIAFATPFFVFWGWLSDKIGRKWIMMVGMALAIVTYRPIFSEFLKDTKVEMNLPEKNIFPPVMSIQITEKRDTVITTTSSHNYIHSGVEKFQTQLTDTFFLNTAKPKSISEKIIINKKLNTTTYIKFIFLVFILILYVTMVYGPIAAFLVEMFPTKIRYTSMSLPYHIGNGVFGGLVPFIGLLLTTSFPSDPLVGLWYPIGVAALCLLIGTVYLRNKIDENVED